MEIVAHFLQTTANSCAHDSTDFDLFGRSAFNRYYYASYLKVRAMLETLNEEWVRTQHASIPELLNGQILTTIRRNRVRASKLDDNPAVQICRRAESSTRQLAELMRQAYAVRVTADYNPEVRVVTDNRGRFQLNLVSVTIAHDWPRRVDDYRQLIERAWSIVDV